MDLKGLIRRTAIFVMMLTLTASCADIALVAPVTGKPGYGPPPHAPAHGYRHKQRDGVELVYNAGDGVYVVVGFTDYYFWDDYYYRLVDDRWQVSVHVSGPWNAVEATHLPPGLQRKAKAHKKSMSPPGHGSQKKNR